MDWFKAKNILIMAFIITNIFLIYHVAIEIFYSDRLDLVGNEYIANVEKYLQESGISLKAEIPREIYSLPLLVVKYETYDEEEMAARLLGEDYEVIDDYTFKNAGKELIIEGNKLLKYINREADTAEYGMDEELAIQISEAFLKENGLFSDDLALKQVYLGVEKQYDEIPVFKVVYHQTYKERFLGESYIHVYTNYRGVVGMEAMLLSQEKTQSDRVKTIPATEALLRIINVITSEEQSQYAITKIEMGYYFNPYQVGFSSWQYIESGTAFPAWKITLENGKIYYVEALKN